MHNVAQAIAPCGTAPGLGAAAQPSRAEFIEIARGIGEVAWSKREQIERDRRIPDDLIRTLYDSGLVRLLRHRRWGGHESDPMTFLDVGREIARGLPSLGWIYTIMGFHEWYLAFAPPQLQADIWGAARDPIVADSFAPLGKVERVADGYRISGNWRFTSGVEWCSWLAVGAIAIVPDRDEPEHVLFFLPREDCTVIDDWHTLGLRGTASRAVSIDGVFIPEHRVMPLMRLQTEHDRGPIVDDGPLWRMSFTTMQGLAIMTASLGASQRMVDEFHSWAKSRVRMFSDGTPNKQVPAQQLALAEGATQWDATWALAQKYAQEGWDRAVDGRDWILSEQERATYFSWRGYIGSSAVELSSKLYLAAGANAIFDSHPMQQLFRDVHSSGAHTAVDRAEGYTARGSAAMGFNGNIFQ